MQSDFPQDLPLRSDVDTPHGDLEDRPIPRRRRALDDQIEKVTDETGEMVRGAFLQFLETYLRRKLKLIVDMTTILMPVLNQVLQLAPRHGLVTFTLHSSKKLSDSD